MEKVNRYVAWLKHLSVKEKCNYPNQKKKLSSSPIVWSCRFINCFLPVNTGGPWGGTPIYKLYGYTAIKGSGF